MRIIAILLTAIAATGVASSRVERHGSSRGTGPARKETRAAVSTVDATLDDPPSFIDPDDPDDDYDRIIDVPGDPVDDDDDDDDDEDEDEDDDPEDAPISSTTTTRTSSTTSPPTSSKTTLTKSSTTSRPTSSKTNTPESTTTDSEADSPTDPPETDPEDPPVVPPKPEDPPTETPVLPPQPDPTDSPGNDDPKCPWKKSEPNPDKKLPWFIRRFWYCLKEAGLKYPEMRADMTRLMKEGIVTGWGFEENCYQEFKRNWIKKAAQGTTHGVYAVFSVDSTRGNQIRLSRLITDFIPVRDFTVFTIRWLSDFEIWACRP